MSDFLAEARVIVRPDTTRFRAELVAQLAAVTRGVTVPVPVTPVATSTAGLVALTAEANRATAAQNQVAGATRSKALADKAATAEAAAHARQLGQVRTAALASFASMTGLRGAVLTAGGAFIGATIAIQSFVKAVEAAATLETNLNVFRVTAGATADELERVRAEAIALGRDIRLPAVSAGDAAEAITLLARAGLSVEDSLAGARGVLQLATAAQIDNATATELAASALNAFGLAGEDAVAVADLLANSANQSQGEITDMGIALRQSAGAAAQVGLTLEETVTVLTSLARTGLAGSDAGTTLRVALLRLVAPTKDAAAALERFNINLRDAQGNLRVEAFFELEEALRGVTRAEADRARVAIFGQNAFRVSALLGRESAASFADLEQAVTKQGAAAELAGARTEGFAGQMEALSSNLETLGTNLGTLILPPLSLLVQTLNEFVSTTSLAVEGAIDLASGIGDIAEQAEEAIPFVDRLRETLTETFLRGFDPTRRPRQLIGLFAEQLDRFGDSTEQTATQVENDVRQMFAAFSEQGGLGSATALNEFVNGLDELADSLAKGDPEAQRLARRIRELIKELQNPATFIVDLDFDFDESDIRAKGQQAGADTAEGALQSLRAAGSQVAAVGLDWIEDLAGATVPAAAKAGEDTGDAFIQGFNQSQIRGQLQAQKTAVAQAQAFGDTGLEELLAERDRIDRILNSAKAPTGPALESLLRERQSVIDEIASILEEQADAEKDAARKAKQAQDEADEALLDLLSNRRDDAARKAATAATTEGVADDIRAQDRIQALIKQQIRKVRAQVRDEEARRDAIRELRIALLASRAEENALRQQQREDQQSRIDDIQQLNIQIAQETENDAALERAINARITRLNKQIKAAKGDQLKVKQLILERERLKNQLDELGKKEKEVEKTVQQQIAERIFQERQVQQGFVSNLLGNIITGPTEGLVGVPSPAAPPLPDLGVRAGAEAGAAAGRADRGPTAGQASTTNNILLRILGQLESLNRVADSPEAIYQNKMGSAAMTGGGGNSEVM